MRLTITKGLTKIELAELMVENLEEFKERDSVELAETWDSSDMIKELTWGDVIK